jgi:2-furoyl-CoA dehydrogenase FAD binding subunit
MKPAKFDYLRAETLDEALATLRTEGEAARIIAGGQSLLPMLNMRLARPAVIVDIMRIAALAETTATAETLRIGAAVHQATLQARPNLHPLLAAALPWVGHAQTRSRGTLCGSVAHADPSAEIPLVLLALHGEILLRSARRARRVPAAQFFTGMMQTARQDDEMIEAITLPNPRPDEGYAFREVGRRHGDFAIIACAAVAHPQGIRLAIGGVADHPVLRELPADTTQWDAALDAFAWSLEARDDLHATAEYRRQLVRKLGRQVMQEAAACRA